MMVRAGQEPRPLPRLPKQEPRPQLQRRLSDPPEAQASRSREEQSVAISPSSRSGRKYHRPRDPSASVSRAESIKRKSSAQKALVTKFDDHVTSEMAESSRRSDPINASSDLINKLIEVS